MSALGGAIFSDKSEVIIRNCEFNENIADNQDVANHEDVNSEGGAIYVEDSILIYETILTHTITQSMEIM